MKLARIMAVVGILVGFWGILLIYISDTRSLIATEIFFGFLLSGMGLVIITNIIAQRRRDKGLID